MPQSIRTPTRLDYGGNGAFHVSAFNFDLILIFVRGAGLPIDMLEYGISIWLGFSLPLERHFQLGDFDDSLFLGTACDESWAVGIYGGLGQRCSVDQQHQHEKIYGL